VLTTMTVFAVPPPVSADDSIAMPALVLEGERRLAVEVKGQPASFQVRPDAVSLPVINPAAAQALSLKPSLSKARTVVGRTTLRGFTDAVPVKLDGASSKLRIVWFDRPLVEGSDGVIGPGGLAARVVVFRLRAPQPGEREIVLPMEDRGTSGIITRLQVGDVSVPVQFNLETDETIVSAAAGAKLAAVHTGAMQGASYELRVDFDVKRPVRSMRFAAQPRLAGLVLDNIVVRTADASTVGVPDAEADPDEIVVTGAGKKGAVPSYRIHVGRDALKPCSSLTFDKPARQIRLMCRALAG